MTDCKMAICRFDYIVIFVRQITFLITISTSWSVHTVMGTQSRQLHHTAFADLCDIIHSQVFAATLESFNAALVSGGVPLSVPLLNR